MEDSSSQPFDHDQTAPGASKFLSDLPSRGHLSSTIISSNLGGMRVYICEHNTSPPGLLKKSWIAALHQRKPIQKIILNRWDQAVVLL
ncbi:hypothetical protein ES319_D08G284900v1 [Gossypium barbadense]|uniref:DET1- and DDB1-associated protein 1 n=1 Tax=Gossypium barbadense TaxID=3634 RepID=A0A5J5QJX5_GOSBA|nr:hypothetical protein ES319_D08G284900v1 [Gossypium barbadense]